MTIKEELFKDKTTGMKTIIGPPFTMLLIAEGLLIVQQEVEAGILMPSILESGPVNKKMKHASKLEPSGTGKGESSLQQAKPDKEVALIQPDLTQTLDHHPCIISKALQDILEKFEQTNFSIQTTFQEWSKVVQKQALEAALKQQDETSEHLTI
jgi:hypothetical protein